MDKTTSTIDAKILGQQIARRRQDAGVLSEQLADRIGVNKSSITNIEQGYCLPQPDNFQAICNMLNVSPDILLQTDDKDSLILAIEEHCRFIESEFGKQLLYGILSSDMSNDYV